MSGFDVAKALRKIPIAMNSLFVIHTALRETDIDAADIPEVDLFLPKPLTQEKIKKLFQSSRQPRIETNAAATKRA
jgi:DNA-binding LytR/AlgR family response regulator